MRLAYNQFESEVKEEFKKVYKDMLDILEKVPVVKPNILYDGLAIKFKDIPITHLENWYMSFNNGFIIKNMIRDFNKTLVNKCSKYNIPKINKNLAINFINRYDII